MSEEGKGRKKRLMIKSFLFLKKGSLRKFVVFSSTEEKCKSFDSFTNCDTTGTTKSFPNIEIYIQQNFSSLTIGLYI